MLVVYPSITSSQYIPMVYTQPVKDMRNALEDSSPTHSGIKALYSASFHLCLLLVISLNEWVVPSFATCKHKHIPFSGLACFPCLFSGLMTFLAALL